MKLRVRSTATKETLRIEAPDPCSLPDLKALIAAQLFPPVAPESIRFSLNRKDELLPASPDDDSLRAVGLTSGDLLFFSLCSEPDALTLTPTAVGSSHPPPAIVADVLSRTDVEGMAGVAAISPLEHTNVVDTKEVARAHASGGPDSMDVTELPEKSPNLVEVQPSDSACSSEGADAEKSTRGSTDDNRGEDEMEVVQDLVAAKKFSVPGFLKRVMEVENVPSDDLLRCLVMVIHAALLESGFVVSGDGGGYRLPEGSLDASGVLSLQYSVPQLVGLDATRNVKNVILKFSKMGIYATVYAYLTGGQSDVYRVCFSLLDAALGLVLEIDTLEEFEEKKVFELWKMVKDKLALPLLIDICDANGLPSPPCFMLLPTDLKLKILTCVPGVDVAAFACTCSELRYISSNDELWKEKFEDEFGLLNERGLAGRSWRDKYVNCWVKAKNAKRMRVERERVRIRPNVPVPLFNPVHPFRQPHRFPVIGGDYDWSPGGGGLPPMGPRLGFPRFSSQRRFSPDCHLGDRDADYIE